MAGVQFILSYELHRTNNCHSHHYKFKFNSSLKAYGIKDNRVGWWPTLQERCPCKFYTTSFLLQIILFFSESSTFNIYIIDEAMCWLQREQCFWWRHWFHKVTKRKCLLLWNPKGHEHGRFKSYFMLLIIKWSWLPTFLRSVVPSSVLTFLEVSTLTSLFMVGKVVTINNTIRNF